MEGLDPLQPTLQTKARQLPHFLNTFGPAHAAVPSPERPVLLMSEQGLSDTLQFARYALALQNQGIDVTVLKPVSLVNLLRDAVGLRQVDDQPRPRRATTAEPTMASADESRTTDGMHQ